MKSPMTRMQTFRVSLRRLAPIVLLAAFFTAAPFHTAMAQVAPPLGTTQSVAVLGGSTVTNTGPTIVIGDLDLSPGTAVTGFPPGTVTGGTTHAADAVALQAQSDNTAAYLNLAGQPCGTTYAVPTDIGGLTLVPGVYCFTSSALLTGALTLDGQGNSAAVWVFKTVSTLTTASSSSVVLTNGAAPCNVFWQVGSSTTIGTATNFVGNIFALTSISLTTGATVAGRALARNGAVTMDTNTVSITACGGTTGTPVPPTLSKAFSPATLNAGGTSTLTITLSNPNTTRATLTAPFTDTLPSGLIVSGGGTTTCGGALTATAGSSTLTLTAGTIPVNGSCVLVVDVAAANGGSYINSLAVGALMTSNGNNAAPAVATLTVNSLSVVTPTLGKAFSPATIAAGGISILTITLNNANTTLATLTGPLTDTLPSGVVVAGSVSSTCIAPLTGLNMQQLTRQPRIEAVAFRIPVKKWAWLTGSASTVTIATGTSIPTGGSCTVTVPVTAPVAGVYFNAMAAGALQTNNGTNAAPAVATLTVLPVSIAPTLSKSFSPAAISAGGISTLTITLNNPNKTIANLTAPLTDTLPNGVLVAGSISSSCIAPPTSVNIQRVTRQPRIETVAFRMPVKKWAWLTGSTSTVSMVGGSIPASGSCTLTVSVTAPVAGSYFNSLPAGALQTNKGNNAAPAVATLTVSAMNNADISLAMVTPGTVQITRGVPATVMMSVVTNPSNMPIPMDVSFGCSVPSGLTGTTCSLNPAKITVGSPSGRSTTLTINTIRGTTNSNLLPFGPGARLPWYLLWVSVATVFALAGLLGFARNSTSRRLLPYYLSGVLLAITAGGLAGCGVSTTGTSASVPFGSASVAGTPIGPSIITATSTAAGIMKTVSIPINVN